MKTEVLRVGNSGDRNALDGYNYQILATKVNPTDSTSDDLFADIAVIRIDLKKFGNNFLQSAHGSVYFSSIQYPYITVSAPTTFVDVIFDDYPDYRLLSYGIDTSNIIATLIKKNI